MAVTYTTSAIVRKLVKNISSDLLDADIERYIYEAENIINVTTKYPFIATFDETKHGILRSCATHIAAIPALAYDVGTTFKSLDDAKTTAEIINTSIDRNLELLSDPRTVEYLKSL